MALEEGKKAPMFTLPSSEGGRWALKDHAGKYVVVYFYPRDNTPGCTTEAVDFRDAADALAEAGAVVVGISKDSLVSHGKFRDKHDLNFPLLTDEKGTVLAKYGAWGEKKMYGKTFEGLIRTTVVIAPDQKVVKVFPKVRVKGHVTKVLETLSEHRSG
ncbi:MAG: thioredoxin-dependent thiol peroxidase [Myxococcota bacterium]